ncbi:ABC transporter ATP-binding protein [Microbacterium aurantiacum]|uniref:ABC transporter ATP-binding protein n=1 Tax=Microbacterium aurantiacum TaxID=162393 RepID=UPI001F4684C2|nr:ABC transporter ATP-binding protein [Microbacterium aurantiacum]
MEAHAGQVLGILGPNGAGKTSLLRILAGLRRPETGAVTLSGRDLRGMRRRIVARRLAIVEQSPEVHGDITVQETAALGRTPHRGTFAALDREHRAAIERALSLTGMSPYRSRTWRSLSGGEQQRAQLARALAQNPEVLVLDEPTNHLDIRYQLDVLALVASLDMTVITALHDLNLAARFCDRIVVLHGGHVRASGAPADVLTPELLRSVYDVDAVVATSPYTGSQVATYLGAVADRAVRAAD